MLRGFDYGFLAALGVALAHGVAWWLGLTFGLLAVAIAGGWLIGYAVRLGVAAHQARQLENRTAAEAADDEIYGRPPLPAPRGSSPIAAALGAAAWVLGSFVAFAIVQLTTGQGEVAERFTPAKLAAFLESVPQLLQLAALAAYVAVAWFAARRTRPPNTAKGP